MERNHSILHLLPRKRVIFDFDQTLIPTVDWVKRRIKRDTGVSFTLTHHRLQDDPTLPDDIKVRAERLFNSPVFMSSIPPVQEEVENFYRVCSYCDVHIITSRPFHRELYRRTIDRYYPIFKVPIVFVEDKVSVLLKQDCDYYFDDDPTIVELARENGIEAYVIDAEYNRNYDLKRIFSLADVLTIINNSTTIL